MLEILESTILIRINQLYSDDLTPLALYEATRGVWKMGPRREQAQIAFAVYKGEVKEVFQITNWNSAGTAIYETRDREEMNLEGRWEFIGELATDEIREKYLGQSVADYFEQGNINPITYVNC